MADNRHKTMTARVVGPHATAGSQTASNLQKVDRLASVVEKVLTTTAHGEFFEASKSSNAARDKQLPEMFALRAEIQELKAGMERKQAEEEDAESADKKATFKPNASMIAVINNIVAERLTAEMRDTNIHISRLQERAEKAEQKNTLLEEKIVSLEAKSKKTTPKPGCTPEQFQSLRRKVTETESNLKKAPEESESLRKDNQTLRKEVQTLRDADTRAESEVRRIAQANRDLAAKVERLFNDMEESTEQSDSRLDRLEALDLDEVSKRLNRLEALDIDGVSGRLSRLEALDLAEVPERLTQLEALNLPTKLEELQETTESTKKKTSSLSRKLRSAATLLTELISEIEQIDSLQTRVIELETRVLPRAGDPSNVPYALAVAKADIMTLKRQLNSVRRWCKELDADVE